MGKEKASQKPLKAPDISDAQQAALSESRSLRAAAAASGLLAPRDEKPSHYPRLAPSRALLACSGHDIVRKGGHRKAKFLFAFPGRLAPRLSGGKLGTLHGLDTLNPSLALDFPTGKLLLRGTLLATAHRFLTLQCNPGAAARVVMRAKGNLRLILNAKLWSGMVRARPAGFPPGLRCALAPARLPVHGLVSATTKAAASQAWPSAAAACPANRAAAAHRRSHCWTVGRGSRSAAPTPRTRA